MSSREVLIAPPKVGLGVIGLAISLGVLLGFVSSQSVTHGVRAYLECLPVPVLVGAVLSLAMTSRVAARGDTLRVYNVIFVWEIPASRIQSLEFSNGFRCVADDLSIDCVMYGPSLLQAFHRSTRSRTIAARLSSWLRSALQADLPRPERQIQKRLRPALWRAPVLVLVLYWFVAYLFWR